MGVKMNCFYEDLAYSNNKEDELFWENAYKTFFSDYKSMEKINNLELQRIGRDRIVYLKTGLEIYIDEKKRRTHYDDDIFLEYKDILKNGEERPGWMEKPLKINYLAYAIMPIRSVFLLDWQMLRKLWSINKEKWMKTYISKPAKNMGYITYGLIVPLDVLYKEIGRMTVIWNK
jgi:hypothetical protein